MATNFSPKAQALRAELISLLNVLPTVSALTKTPSFGASGECDLAVGTQAAGSDNAFIRIRVQDTVQKDVLGLAQQVFTPHIAQVVFEANPAGGVGADVGTWATRLAILGCLAKTGIKIELYFSANTVLAAAAGITGAPTATLDNAYFPLMSTM